MRAFRRMHGTFVTNVYGTFLYYRLTLHYVSFISAKRCLKRRARSSLPFNADPRWGDGGKGYGPQTAADQKIKTTGRSKVAFIRPTMHQNSPFLSSKSKKCSGEGAQPPPPLGRETPLPTPTPHWILALDSILASHSTYCKR